MSPNAALVFSGGATKKDSTQTEAESYHTLAMQLGLLGNDPSSTRADLGADTDIASRVILEQYARDSLENLAYAAAVFQEKHGRLPRHVHVNAAASESSVYVCERECVCVCERGRERSKE